MAWIACALGCALFMLWMWVAHKKDKGVWSFFRKLPCKDYDGSALRATPTASPSQYGEHPTIPPAIIVHLSLSDREKIREENWQRLKAAMLKHQDAERVANLIRELDGAQ